MKKLMLVLAVVLVSLISCDTLNVTTLTVDGAVIYQETTSRFTGTYGIFVVAKADVESYDRNAIPEITPPPPDTNGTVPQLDLPSFLTPERGAQVVINNTTLHEEYDGQYQGELNGISPNDSVFVNVYTQSGDTGTAKLIMPGEFSINLGDTVISYDSLSSLNISWSNSENASAYMVLLYSIDTTTQNMNLTLKETVQDTFYTVEKSQLSPGTYLLQVASIYGKLNASMPQAGTLVGILGQVATLYVKRPVLIEVQ